MGKPTLRSHRRIHDTDPDSVGSLNLPAHAYNALTRYVRTISELITYRPAEVKVMRGIGKKGIEAINEALAERGLSLRSQPQRRRR